MLNCKDMLSCPVSVNIVHELQNSITAKHLTNRELHQWEVHISLSNDLVLSANKP